VIDYVIVVEKVDEILYFEFCVFFSISVLDEDSFVANSSNDIVVVANCNHVACEDVEFFVIEIDANDWAVGRNASEAINGFFGLFWRDGYFCFFYAGYESNLAELAGDMNLVADCYFVKIK
jgi:hypothetical protein